MKILSVNGAHPDEKIGGAELQSWLLSRALANRHEVTFLGFRSDTEEDTTDIQDNVSVIKLAKSKKFSLKELQRIDRCIEHVQPDVIYLRMFDYIYLLKCISIRRNIPLVFHVSSMYNCLAIRPARPYQVVRRARHLVNHLLMQRLAGVVYQTEDQRKMIGRTKYAATVIRNSAFGEWSYSTDKDEKLVLWVGNIKSLKRPMDFVEIANEFKDKQARFLMIGYPQDQELARKIEKESNHLANLDYIPGVPIGGINAFFQKASIFVSTSEVEGYPNTFIQAIQSATPVISLRLDPDNLLTRYQVGKCATDLRQLKTSLTALLKDSAQLESMRRNTMRCFNENFDVKSNSKGLEKYLMDVSTS